MKINLATFLFVLGAFCAVEAFAQKAPFVSGEWAPYVSEKMPGQGPLSEIVFAATKAAGLEPSVAFFPWARAEAEVASGAAFATYPYAITDERKKSYDFSDQLASSKSMIFYVSGKGKYFAWNSLSDFKSYKVGGIAGYNYIEDLSKNGIKPEMATGIDLILKMAYAGRIDYFIEDELVAREAIKAIYPGEQGKFLVFAKPYKDSPLYLMVSKKYPGSADLLKRFNGGLATIRKNGTYAAILSKYGIKE